MGPIDPQYTLISQALSFTLWRKVALFWVTGKTASYSICRMGRNIVLIPIYVVITAGTRQRILRFICYSSSDSSGSLRVRMSSMSGIQTNLEVDIYGALAERWSGETSKGRKQGREGRGSKWDGPIAWSVQMSQGISLGEVDAWKKCLSDGVLFLSRDLWDWGWVFHQHYGSLLSDRFW